MVRALSILFVALLAAGLVYLPPAQPARLAALHVGELLNEVPDGVESAVEGSGEEGSEHVPTLAERILNGEHAYDRTDVSLKFGFFGARMEAPAAERDTAVTLHWLLRTSVVEGLREAAGDGRAHPGGEGDPLTLIVPGAEMPQVGGASFLASFEDHTLWLEYQPANGPPLRVTRDYRPPTKLSLLPPLIAILLAIALRRPVPALFLGVFTGALLVRHTAGSGLLAGVGLGFVDVFGTYFRGQLLDWWRAETIGFVVFMLAMVGVITKNGGLRGLMDLIARRATSARSTQVATYLMGLAVFFDDYANTILVGSTMRPLTDRFRIAREKLAYIVDSTAAPVAGISIFSTWIAFEVSTFSAQLPAAGLTSADGYSVFLQTLPYRFYCIFSIAMVALVTLTGRDFGPMLKAERRARTDGHLVRLGGKPMVGDHATKLEPAERIVPRARRAIVPLLVFIGVTLLVIVWKGGGFTMSFAEWTSLAGFTGLLGAGGGVLPLFLGSAAGFLTAVGMSLWMGLRGEVAGAAWNTMRSMGIAIVILYLAWMIGAVCDTLGTAPYLTELVGDTLQAELLPIVLFVLSGVVAFSTGSSWSTMGILLPLVVGLSYTMGDDAARAAEGATHLTGMRLMILSIGAVLEGAIFGDHCSPISDTTVLSSIASASDHIDHVRTQIPYALATMAIAIVAGYFPCAFFGLSPYVGWVLGLALLTLLIMVTGKRVESAPG